MRCCRKKFTFAISSPDEFLFKQLLLRNCAVDFVEICKACVGKMIIKATKWIFNSDKICRSYSDLNFGVTFLNTVYSILMSVSVMRKMFTL